MKVKKHGKVNDKMKYLEKDTNIKLGLKNQPQNIANNVRQVY